MPKKIRSEELGKLFLKTPEMQECQKMADTIGYQLNEEDTVPIQVDVPKEFIRLVEFLEQKRAQDKDVAPSSAASIINRMVLNELQDQLHWLTVGPDYFEHYRDLWNRFCDAQGCPEEKSEA